MSRPSWAVRPSIEKTEKKVPLPSSCCDGRSAVRPRWSGHVRERVRTTPSWRRSTRDRRRSGTAGTGYAARQPAAAEEKGVNQAERRDVSTNSKCQRHHDRHRKRGAAEQGPSGAPDVLDDAHAQSPALTTTPARVSGRGMPSVSLRTFATAESAVHIGNPPVRRPLRARSGRRAGSRQTPCLRLNSPALSPNALPSPPVEYLTHDLRRTRCRSNWQHSKPCSRRTGPA